MLVLSRKCGERVVVCLNGETVTVEILKIIGRRIRIGFDAPREVGVHREELWKRVLAEKTHERKLQAAG